MGRVLNDPGALWIGQAEQRIHVTWLTVKMDGDHGLDLLRHPSGECLLDGSWINVERLRVDINQQWPSAGMFNDMNARGKRHWCADHGVVLANPQDNESQVKGGRARVQPQRILGADEPTKLVLESGGLWP